MRCGNFQQHLWADIMTLFASLTYYPIKACRGFDVNLSLVTRMGLEHDRNMNV